MNVTFLCEQCERAYADLPAGSPAPVYVIGTEVPPQRRFHVLRRQRVAEARRGTMGIT